MKDLESLRVNLDKSLTLFHFKKAKKLAKKGLIISKQKNIKSLEYFFNAQIFIIEHNFRMALNYLTLSLQENPGDCFSLNDKGICLAELGRLDEATIYFDKAINVFADYPGFYQNKGWLITLKGDFRGALFYFFKTLELDEQRPDALFSIGYCFEKISEIKKAKHYYLKALELVRGKSSLARLKIEKALRRV